MKNVFIIIYELSNPSSNYDRLGNLIRSQNAWARLGSSVYIIETTETAIQVRDKLIKVLNMGDKLYVGKVGAPAAWTGISEEVSMWLKNKLH